MTQIIQSVVKLAITAYLLFGGYILFCGFVEKSRKKKIAGALILILPTIALVVTLVILYNKYGTSP